MDQRFKYRPQLDGMRALAVIMVLAVHASYGQIVGGFLGVDVFFVLSGFLITGLLLDEKHRREKIDLVAFYVRRAFRILPPLVACLILAGLLWDGRIVDWMLVSLAVLTFVANFIEPEFMGSMGHAWSLSIEEQFYLVWPVVVLTLISRNTRGLIIVALLVALTAFLVRLYFASVGDAEVNYTFTLARMDSLMWGGLLALTRSFWSEKISRLGSIYLNIIGWLSILAILLFGLLASKVFMQSWTPGFTLFAVIVALLIIALEGLDQRQWLRRLFEFNAVQYIGRRSYGLYLYHYPIFLYLENFRQPGDLANFGIVLFFKLALSLLATELSYRYVERPMLSAKTKWNNNRRAGIVVGGVSK